VISDIEHTSKIHKENEGETEELTR